MPKSVLVTGCSTGIGYTSAYMLKERGWQVFTTARKASDVASLKAADMDAVFLDYCDDSSINATVEHILDATGGRLDALFNNGAYGLLGAVEDITTDDLRAQFEANFFGWHTLSRKVVPVMRKQGGGRIVQCSSVLGIVSGRHRAAYSATKHALEALSASMRMELRGDNIHVSVIRPGPIDTEFLATALRILKEKIDLEGSAHAADYKATLERMNRGNRSSVFKLPPEAVVKSLIHALESTRPKAIYSVTTLTRIADALRRLLPTRTAERLFEKG